VWIPRQVPGLEKMSLVAGGWRHMLAADSSGALWAWGWGKFGQLGLGNNQDVVDSPQRVEVSRGGQLRPPAVVGWLANCLPAAA
jgi:alpha-tubulin suppressor-like RCC1 family protein